MVLVGGRKPPLAVMALVVASATLATCTRPAHAAFTASERTLARNLYAQGALADVPRARALLARPDHAPEDVAAVTVAMLGATPFDEPHRAWLHELLHGPTSLSSRSALAPAIVAGLVARSEAIFRAHPDDLEAHAARVPATAEELARVHAFVATDIASAGKPPEIGHDGSAGIRDEARRAATEAYRAHVAQHRTFLTPTGDETREPSAALYDVRCQATATLVELASGLAPRAEVATWLGLRGAVRSAFERSGLVIVPDGPLDDGRARELVRALEASPAFGGVELALVGKRSAPSLAVRGPTLRINAPLGAIAPLADDALFPASVESSRPDALVAAAALEGARAAALRLGEARPAFAALADRIAARAREDGESGYLSFDLLGAAPESERAGIAKVGLPGSALAAASARLALVDLPRALDLALLRTLEGKTGPLAQLQLGLSLLALPASGSAAADSLTAGRTRGDGHVEPLAVTHVKTAESGLVTAFTVEGHAYAIDEPSGKVTRDGAPVTLGILRTARIPKLEGDTFAAPTRTWRRLTGKPRVGVVDDGRVRVVASRQGFDAIGLDANADVRWEADLVVDAAAAALAVRALPGDGSFVGLALLVVPGEPSTAQLLAVDASGRGAPLAPPMELEPQPEGGWHVVLEVKGDKLAAQVGERVQSGPVPPGYDRGAVALAARGPGYVEARGATLGAPGKKRPAKPLPPGKPGATRKKP